MIVVGDNRAAGVHPVSRQARMHKRSRDNARAEQFAHGDDDVKRADGHLAEHGQCLDDGREFVELLVEAGGERNQRRVSGCTALCAFLRLPRGFGHSARRGHARDRP
mgnify:CR=1 FL=1